MKGLLKILLMSGIMLLGMSLFTGCGDEEVVSPDTGFGGESNMPEVGSNQESVAMPQVDATPGGDQSQNENDEQQSTSYIWQELTITVPESWRGTCLFLEEENGFKVYQKASYEKDGSSGYICSFWRVEEYFRYEAGESLLAYTDEGVLYYLMRPTDVPCDTRDEAILSEYVGLCEEVDAVKASLEIAGSNIHRDAGEYILPVSSILPVTREVLLNFSDNELWIARNEIYARHGRKFTNEYLQRYFSQCSWYEGTTAAADFDDNTLSQVERDNIAVLMAAEAEYDAEHPYPEQCKTTDTVQADLHGDGTDNTIGYHVEYLKNDEVKCYITVDGATYCASDLIPMWYPRDDVFYIVDILEGDGVLEIALLDNGPSTDYTTYFFRLEETLSYIGQVSGHPFPEENSGFNGFSSQGIIAGTGWANLIETAPLKNYWRYDSEKQWIVYQDYGWYEYQPGKGHTLYEDLPVRKERDAKSELVMIPAQGQVFFLGTDNWEWILVKGKDGSMGYMQVKDGVIVELNKPAEEVFSDLHFYG